MNELKQAIEKDKNAGTRTGDLENAGNTGPNAGANSTGEQPTISRTPANMEVYY